MEIDYKTGDLVTWFNKPAIIIYAHPSDPMVQIVCEGKKVWAIKGINVKHAENVKLVEA
tara:strand:+ start:252 stop:428 length:177 start_codon:yes stop_codon:yes gene_type:complete